MKYPVVSRARYTASATALAALAILGACADNTVSTVSGPKPPQSLDYEAIATGSPVFPGHVVACINSAAPAGNYSVMTSVVQNGGGPYTTNSPTVLTPGSCAYVFTRTSPASSDLDPMSDVTVTVTNTPSGTDVLDPVCYAEVAGDIEECAEPDQTADVAEVELNVNSYHGSAVIFNFETGTTGGGGDPHPGGECTYTQGFYKNHEEFVAELLGSGTLDFTATGGLFYSQFGATLTAEEIDAILHLSPGQYAASADHANETQYMALLHQLITARLNAANGADTDVTVNIDGTDVSIAFIILLSQDYVADLDIDLGGVGAPSTAQLEILIDALDDFNNGLIVGAAHCDAEVAIGN